MTHTTPLLYRITLLILALLFLFSTVACLEEGESAVTSTGESASESTEPAPIPSVVDTSKAEYTYSEMEEDLSLLSEAYPSLFSYHTIGTSLDNREIYCAVLGNPNAEKQIVLHAAIHAREYMTALLTMKLLEDCLTGYETASYNGVPTKELLSDFCFYVVPMANPDGVMLSIEGSSAIRDPALLEGLREIYERDASYGYATTSAGVVMDFETYLRYFKANARGVDLNRNYDALWQEYNDITAPCFRGYKGESPASEPETKAMISLVESLKNPVALLSIHAQGSILYWNCGQENTIPSLSLAHAVSSLTGYRVVYDQNNDASLNDWIILKKGLPSLTIEIGRNKCPLEISEFPTIYAECRDLIPMLADFYR